MIVMCVLDSFHSYMTACVFVLIDGFVCCSVLIQSAGLNNLKPEKSLAATHPCQETFETVLLAHLERTVFSPPVGDWLT